MSVPALLRELASLCDEHGVAPFSIAVDGGTCSAALYHDDMVRMTRLVRLTGEHGHRTAHGKWDVEFVRIGLIEFTLTTALEVAP